MTSYTLRKGNPATTRTDVVVIGVARDAKGSLVAAPGGEAVASAYGRKFAPMLASMSFTGAAGQVVRVPTGGAIKASVLVAVGLGERDALSLLGVRRAAGVAARNLGNAASVALALPAHDAERVAAVVEGFGSGLYRYAGFHAVAKAPTEVEVVVLSDAARKKDVAASLTRTLAIGDALDHTRDVTNQPPNMLDPVAFAEWAQARLHGTKVDVEVLDEKHLADLNCGGILGVGMGSDNPPRLVKMTWKPRGAKTHVALIGKGITYDSGGLTIKPGGSMATMKCDMAGAAAVINTMKVIAELDLPVQVTAFAPMAENMISGDAMRPGDVLTMHDGQTVEVRNTDAEGRLILADALAMAKALEPDAILNIATLTGPCVVALGDRVAGLFGTDDEVAAVEAAASSAGELVWHMPVTARTRESLRTESKVADVLQHNWVRFGSASWAAGFLMEFVGDVPFAHLDIAGPAWNDGAAWGHIPNGATGFGVPTMVEWVASKAALS